MKTKLITILLLILLVIPILAGGCTNTATLGTIPSSTVLSQMTEKEIADKIDSLTVDMEHETTFSLRAVKAEVIQVYENELILRQLERLGK